MRTNVTGITIGVLKYLHSKCLRDSLADILINLYILFRKLCAYCIGELYRIPYSLIGIIMGCHGMHYIDFVLTKHNLSKLHRIARGLYMLLVYLFDEY